MRRERERPRHPGSSERCLSRAQRLPHRWSPLIGKTLLLWLHSLQATVTTSKGSERNGTERGALKTCPKTRSETGMLFVEGRVAFGGTIG